MNKRISKINKPEINIIVPLYNEEKVFDQLISRLQALIDCSELCIEVILVDDGSTDGTTRLLEEICIGNPKFQAVFLSRNFGQQIATTAGLKYVNASKAVLIIDGDLQDPPEVLESFYKYLEKGYDIVYAIRKQRKESLIKRALYRLFYRLLKFTSKIDIPVDSGDFSLISRRTVDILNAMPEESRFLRGMRSWVGFKQIGVFVERDTRHSGKPKFTFSKLVSLAFSGLFNFSELPLRFVFTIGIITIMASMVYFAYTLIQKLFFDATPQGFTALLFTIILFGGIQLISIGLIGSYVVRIFFQVKNRPLFIVKKRIVHGEIQSE